MPRLRRSNCALPGIARRRHGRGFAYYDACGDRISDTETLSRIDGLAIPPAWRDVWICPYPNGHIQATGFDARGRRQYRYHDAWRVQRDREKFDRMLQFGARLPRARERVERDINRDGMPRERVLATAFRLLDVGFFRIGCEEYAEENETFGLATIRKKHVTIDGGEIVFDYPAKSGQRRIQSVVDDDVLDVVRQLKRRRGRLPELLAYLDENDTWIDIKSDDINDYIREVVGGDYTAKDFRTWHATVLAAVALAVSTAARGARSSRKRAVTRAVQEVARYLGNTAAVCRSSYIDPRVVDLYYDGVTIDRALTRLGADAEFGEPATHGNVESAVLTLLRDEAEEERKAS